MKTRSHHLIFDFLTMNEKTAVIENTKNRILLFSGRWSLLERRLLSVVVQELLARCCLSPSNKLHLCSLRFCSLLLQLLALLTSSRHSYRWLAHLASRSFISLPSPTGWIWSKYPNYVLQQCKMEERSRPRPQGLSSFSLYFPLWLTISPSLILWTPANLRTMVLSCV